MPGNSTKRAPGDVTCEVASLFDVHVAIAGAVQDERRRFRGAGRNHDGAHVIHALPQVRHRRHAAGQTGTAFVEEDEAREAGQFKVRKAEQTELLAIVGSTKGDIVVTQQQSASAARP
jgi:hypothetical protein